MIKKNLKYLLSIILVSAVIFSFSVCFADENIVLDSSSLENALLNSNEDTTEIYQDDFYAADKVINMDKYVNGNAYIIGNDVKITGAINGDLFVLANTLTVEKGALINGSIFACANTIYFNGECFDLYAVATDKIDMSIDSYIGRDLRASSTNMRLRSQIDRNANIFVSETLDLGSGEDIPLIFGDLNYSAKSEVQIPDNVFPYEESNVNFTPIIESSKNESTTSVSDIILGFSIFAVACLVIALVVKFFFHTIDEKINKFNPAPSNIFKCFGIGLLILFCMPIVSIFLLITVVGAKLCVILLLILALLCLICAPLSIIFIANLLKEKLNIENNVVYYLLIVLISLIIHAISLIPILGGLVALFLVSTTLGLFFKNSPKEITAEETK